MFGGLIGVIVGKLVGLGIGWIEGLGLGLGIGFVTGIPAIGIGAGVVVELAGLFIAGIIRLHLGVKS